MASIALSCPEWRGATWEIAHGATDNGESNARPQRAPERGAAMEAVARDSECSQSPVDGCITVGGQDFFSFPGWISPASSQCRTMNARQTWIFGYAFPHYSHGCRADFEPPGQVDTRGPQLRPPA